VHTEIKLSKYTGASSNKIG